MIETEAENARCEPHGRLPAKRVVVLGSTGSIGRQALEVIAAVSDLGIAALVANTNVDALLEQARRFGGGRVGFHDIGAAAEAAARKSPCCVYAGDSGVAELIAETVAEAAEAGGSLTVLNGIVGAAGLRATLATLHAGVTLALANKESMVAGGDFVLAAARASGARIIPVDSEHSAIFQCLAAGRSGAAAAHGGEGEAPPLLAAEEILLTGSGGPFRGRTREELSRVTLDEALHHPNWVMGPKVTIDSATLMNKGLEVIEAHYLFGVPYEQIRVVVHPQSIVHSMVRFADGALLAHLGVPDMRTPIGYALSYPERAPLPMVAALDLLARELTFAEPDTTAFRCLALARAVGERAAEAAASSRPIAAPIVLNAANEVAVHAFLAGAVGFLEIEAIVEASLGKLGDASISGLDDVFAADAEARGFAATFARQGSRT